MDFEKLIERSRDALNPLLKGHRATCAELAEVSRDGPYFNSIHFFRIIGDEKYKMLLFTKKNNISPFGGG